MKSFIIIEHTGEKKGIAEGKTDFVPSFPGIYVDLDKTVDADHCDHYLGTAGLGCEYDLKDGQIKKMFLELLPYKVVEFIPEHVAGNIKKQLSREITTHQVISFKNATCFSPKKILLDAKFNLVQFFFSVPDAGQPLEPMIESLHYMKVSPNVVFGLTAKNELASITVSDFSKRIYYNELIMEGHIEGSTERFEHFLMLNRHFFDQKIDSIRYNVLVTNYLKKYNLLDKNEYPGKADVILINSLLNQKTGYK